MCSKLYGILILAFIGYSRVNGYHTTISPKQCGRNLTTNKFEYTTMFAIEEIKNQNEIFLTFFVKAAKDAHIIFSPEKKPTKKNDKSYEIVLGSQENTVISIRANRAGKDMSSRTEAGILSDKEWRQFWIRINSGLIEVGKGLEKSPFLSWKDVNRMPIKHYAFASWKNKNEVNWAFPCSENNASLAHCTNVTKNSNDYDVSYPITNNERDGEDIFLKFYVKTDRDALIVLSSMKQPIKNQGQAYEIGIGLYKDFGYDCTSIRIKRGDFQDQAKICNTIKLSFKEWHHFWIRVSPDRVFQIGNTLRSGPFLVWKHKEPMKIEYFRLASYNSSTVNFAFNCFK